MPNNGWSEHRFVSFDGTPVFYRRFTPSAAPRATILVVHGMGEHGGRYRELIETLGMAGFEAYAPDLRGFGKSGGKRGCLRRFEDHFRDLDALMRLAKDTARPLFVLAHSFGALAVSSWLAAEGDPNRVRGLVFSSPNFGISVAVPRWLHVFAIFFSYVLPDLTQSNRVRPEDLSHDTEIRKNYPFDRLNHSRISIGLYRLMTRQFKRKAQIAGRLTLPILVLQAGEDRVASREATLAFFERLASRDKQIQVLPGLYHEVLNETGRKELYSQIQTWLLSRI